MFNENIPIKVEKGDEYYVPVIYFDRNRIDNNLRNPQWEEKWICEYWDKYSRDENNNFKELFSYRSRKYRKIITKNTK